MIESLVVTALPASFLGWLYGSEIVLGLRGGTSLKGERPVGKVLFACCKYAIVIPWGAMVLQSWGLGLPVVERPEAIRWPALVLWAAGFAFLFAGRLSLGAAFRTPFCAEIRGEKMRLLPCIKAVLDSPSIYEAASSDALPEELNEEQREANRSLVSELGRRGFHCARSVVDRLPDINAEFPELRAGMSGFLGGTACLGMTCSALAAGIMIAGRRLGEIENNYLRVFRMIVLFKIGGDAFADRVNAFNPMMNLGNRMAQWFESEFGSLKCREITGADFSAPSGIRRFLDQNAAACEMITAKVAAKVREVLAA